VRAGACSARSRLQLIDKMTTSLLAAHSLPLSHRLPLQVIALILAATISGALIAGFATSSRNAASAPVDDLEDLRAHIEDISGGPPLHAVLTCGRPSMLAPCMPRTQGTL
jgi:hypothetical protein